MAEFTIPIIGNLLSSLAAEFRDEVKPVPGSVLRCDLAFGANFLGGRICHKEAAKVFREAGTPMTFFMGKVRAS